MKITCVTNEWLHSITNKICWTNRWHASVPVLLLRSKQSIWLRKQFIPKHDSTKHLTLLWCEMSYQYTHAHPMSDSDPCSLGVIADARVTKAAHHTPESANQICFPPSCSVLPSHTPAHWLHRCMCTLWHPENMNVLSTNVPHASRYLDLVVMPVVRFALYSCFWTVLELMWLVRCESVVHAQEYDCDSVNIFCLLSWVLFSTAITALYCQHMCILWYIHYQFHLLNH